MIKQSDLFSGTRLIKNMDAFELDYIPDQILFREQQLSELCFRVSPGFNGGRPMSTICRGQPGTGKTLSVKYLFSEIERYPEETGPGLCKLPDPQYNICRHLPDLPAGHRKSTSEERYIEIFAFRLSRI